VDALSFFDSVKVSFRILIYLHFISFMFFSFEPESSGGPPDHRRSSPTAFPQARGRVSPARGDTLLASENPTRKEVRTVERIVRLLEQLDEEDLVILLAMLERKRKRKRN